MAGEALADELVFSFESEQCVDTRALRVTYPA